MSGSGEVRLRRAHQLRAFLDETYLRYHRPALIRPDPLQFLHAYADVKDREVVALLASGLAYGQVKSIVRSVQRVVDALGPRPARTLAKVDVRIWSARLIGFQHRWTRAEEVVGLLQAVGLAQKAWGSLGTRLAALVAAGDPDLHPALQRWVSELRAFGLPARHSLLSEPARGSACKRLHLMARWMVRCDEVDPGGWSDLSPARLLVPVDVHMHRFGRAFGFTRRHAADLRTAREITEGFRRFSPEDPVRFDFALTRLPIHDRLTPGQVRRQMGSWAH
jgi:uncharacterized protein (TIGR02757 family)